MKTSKKTNKPHLLDKYRKMKTKGEIGNTGLKSLVDLILGATLGATLGAATGRLSLPTGIILIAAGHYLGDDTGVMRTAGSATIAYGIAKGIENKNIAAREETITASGEASKAKERLTHLKDELLSAFYLDKIIKKKAEDNPAVGAIDLSPLEIFEQNNRDEAIRHELENDQEEFTFEVDSDEEDLDDFDDDILSGDLSFAMIEEEPDLTNI